MSPFLVSTEQVKSTGDIRSIAMIERLDAIVEALATQPTDTTEKP